MAGQTTGLQKTYTLINEAVSKNTVVTRGQDDGSCAIPLADNAIPLGVVTNDAKEAVAPSAGGSQIGRNVAVQLSGIAEVELAESVNYGDMVIVAANGKVKPMPQVAEGGLFYILGFAEASGNAGDIIPVTINISSVYIAPETTD